MSKKAESPREVNKQSSFIDCLNLEETTKQLNTLKALIFSASETSQTKIQIIKEELSAGRYEIHSDRIAEKLLEHASVTIAKESEIA